MERRETLDEAHTAVGGWAVRRPPSPTLGRYLLVMTVLLLGGALAGQITHHVTVGPDWAAVTESCFREAHDRLPGPDQALARMPLFDDCRAYVEHRLALFAVTGAALLLAVAAAVALLLPTILLRRLGPRHPVPPPIQARAAEIAHDLGVRDVPTVEFGPWWLREPFTVRAQGATRIVLPLAVRRAAHLDAVLRHETAHVAAGDVMLVWLSRGLLYVLPVVMAVPLVLGVFVDAAYVARAALLWVAGLLLARAVTRDRELEADAHAARAGSADALLALFARAPAGRKKLLALHPPPDHRAAVVADPAWTVGMPATVAAIAAALAVNVWTSGTSIGLSAFVATPLQPYPSLVAGLVAGALLALTWRRPPRTALLGLLGGAAIGLLVSLDQRIPTNVLAGDWQDVIAVPLILAGAAGLLTAIRAWPVPSVFVFGGALWIGFDVAVRAQVTDGPALLWTSGFAGGWLYPGAVFLAVLAVVLGVRRPFAAMTGVLAGLAALAVRWLVPLPALDLYPEAQRDWWTAAAAGFTLVAALLLLGRAADGLVAGPVAAVTVSAGVLVRYLPDWDDPLDAARVYLSRPLAMLLLLTLTVGVLAGLLPSRPAPRRPWLTAAGLTLAACAVAGAVLAGGDALLVR